ncbi:hypothetical protein LWT11_22125 [Enterobacter roggenkampii]|uniref:SDH family Clp fold serine proteinase n=1 Tax=Enterobacter roggenkampii TaxID=1812935 RepID=UPI001E51173A|nr:hypothetical protein [Enterobacter roggenkampii]MCE1990582.1 hypothetical protein [Enterobacter roggenkampii]
MKSSEVSDEQTSSSGDVTASLTIQTEDRTVELEELNTIFGPQLDSGVGAKVTEEERKIYDLFVPADIARLIQNESDQSILDCINDHVYKIKNKYDPENSFRILFLYDTLNSITKLHADKIYQSLVGSDCKDIVLLLRSTGGRVEAAYLISKLCNRYKKNSFKVVIPSEAKSAATLLALGADEIHMGALSELGPIDPQVKGLPILSVSHALEKIVSLADRYPDASDMLSSYLNKNLDIRTLGYFDRVSESAVQYADRLLRGKNITSNKTSIELANHFTNHYKEHGFVIDVDEAKELLGDGIVNVDSPIYKMCGDIHSFLVSFDLCFRLKRENEQKKVIAVGSRCEIVEDAFDD